MLVIFQPELRRMLAELGQSAALATAHEQRENIEVIIQTVERLSEVRIGALIAIEQSIQLQEAVESGIVGGLRGDAGNVGNDLSSRTTPSMTAESSSKAIALPMQRAFFR